MLTRAEVQVPEEGSVRGVTGAQAYTAQVSSHIPVIPVSCQEGAADLSAHVKKHNSRNLSVRLKKRSKDGT